MAEGLGKQTVNYGLSVSQPLKGVWGHQANTAFSVTNSFSAV